MTNKKKKKDKLTPEENLKQKTSDPDNPWSEYEDGWGWEGDDIWFGESDTHDSYDDLNGEYVPSFINYQDPVLSIYRKKRKDIISVLDDTTVFNEKLFEDHVFDKDLGNLEKLGEEAGLNLFYSLMSDIFNSLYKSSAILRPRSEFNAVEHPLFKQQLLLNKTLIRILRATNTYKQIKEDSTLNLLTSKELTSGVSSSVLKIYKNLPFNIEELGNKQEIPQEEQQNLFGDPVDEDFDGWGTEEMETIIGVQIERALRKLKAKVDELMENLSFWGITPDILKTMTPQAQAKIKEMLNNTFHTDVIKLAKSFLQHGSNREESKQITALMKNVMRIDDKIDNVISRDKALLGIMPELFFKKLINRELFCLSGFKTIGRGPIVCCIDDSGSMGPPEGEPAKWARAVFISLSNSAIKNKRHISSCMFSHNVVATIDIPPPLSTEKKLQKIYSFIDRANGGGTDFISPLNWAFKQISTTLNKADIIFITDGECDIPDSMKRELLKKKQLTETKCYLVLIRYNPTYTRSNVISLFDKVYHLNLNNETTLRNLQDISSVRKMLENIH